MRLGVAGLIASPPHPLSDLLQSMSANGLHPGVDSSAISFTEKADLDPSPVAPTYLSQNREEAANLIVDPALAAVSDRKSAGPGVVHLVPPTFVAGSSVMPPRTPRR